MSQHIVITGASGGIGRALAEQFVRQGLFVSGCGRNQAALDSLQKSVSDRGTFESVDVTDLESVQAWADRVCKNPGPPDLLVNNAAIINRNARFVDVPVEEFNQVVDVNIKGVANVMRAFLPAMIERQTGIVINLSSGWGRSTSPEVAPYCCTKWAIEGLTKAVAQELPMGMAAIPFSPNTVNTEMLQSCFGSSTASHSPSPDAWAEVAVPWMLQLGPEHNGKSLSAPVV